MLTNDEIIINDLYKFYKAFVVSKYEEIVPAPHIKSLSRYLMRMALGEINRLVVNMPPQHSKSSMVSLAYPFWLICRNPNTKILIVNNSDGLSETFGLQLRDLFRRYSEYFGIYLSEDKSSNKYMMFQDKPKNGTNYEGSIRLVGAGSSKITGTPVDFIIIDDPYEGFGDTTPTLLEKKINWFNTIILQRLRENSKMIILHTRWMQNDLSGYLKENYPNKYEFVVYPAIKDNGEPLWDYYTIDTLQERRQEMGERLFEAIYQQKPLDETGDFFNTNNLNFVDEFNSWNLVVDTVRSYDCAYSSDDPKKDSDYTGFCKMHKVLGNEKYGHYYYLITDVGMEKWGDDLLSNIQQYARIDSPNTTILAETGTVGGAGEFLFKEYRKYMTGYNFLQSLPTGSKVDRAIPLKNAILDGKIKIMLQDNKRELLLQQLRGFPLASHDDLVDALSYAYNYLENIGGDNARITGNPVELRSRKNKNKRMFRR